MSPFARAVPDRWYIGSAMRMSSAASEAETKLWSRRTRGEVEIVSSRIGRAGSGDRSAASSAGSGCRTKPRAQPSTPGTGGGSESADAARSLRLRQCKGPGVRSGSGEGWGQGERRKGAAVILGVHSPPDHYAPTQARALPVKTLSSYRQKNVRSRPAQAMPDKRIAPPLGVLGHLPPLTLIRRQHPRREGLARARTPGPSMRPRHPVGRVVGAEARQRREEALLAQPAAVGPVPAHGHVDQRVGAGERARRRVRDRRSVQQVARERALPDGGGGAPAQAGAAAALAPPGPVRAVAILVTLDRALEQLGAGIGGRVLATVPQLGARAWTRFGHPVGVAFALPIGRPVEAVALLVRRVLRLELVEAHAGALGQDVLASTAVWVLGNNLLAPGSISHIFCPRSARLGTGGEHEAWIRLALTRLGPAEAVRISIGSAAASGGDQDQQPPPRRHGWF